MDKIKPRPSPDAIHNKRRRERKNTDVQPIENNDDAALETYEQSLERPGDDERSDPTTPNGAVPERDPTLAD